MKQTTRKNTDAHSLPDEPADVTDAINEALDEQTTQQTAHTPTEWTVQTAQDGTLWIQGPAYDETRFRSVCTMPTYPAHHNEARRLANARLIASAPDLLALAQHISVMADDAYLTGHPEWQAIVEEAQSIQKRVSV
jgi:hypothetical protein